MCRLRCIAVWDRGLIIERFGTRISLGTASFLTEFRKNVTIFGEGTFTRTDGTTGTFADTALASDAKTPAAPAVAASTPPAAAGIAWPLVMNLTGGAVHTISQQAAGVTFDMNKDGTPDRTGWITPDEGFLVTDRNGNGKIDNAAEMIASFDDLATLDSNHDGKVDKSDAAFSQLKVWVDKNMDGVSQANELYTLGQLGIASVDVGAKAESVYDNGNLIRADGAFTFTDGRKGDIADVGLQYGTVGAKAGNQLFVTDGATTMKMANGETVQFLDGTGQTVDAGRSGVDIVVDTGAGGNTITAGNAARKKPPSSA